MKKKLFLPGSACAPLLCLLLAATSCTRSVAPSPTPSIATDDELTTNAVAAATPYHNTIVLFNGGSEGYHSYRIPSIVRCNSGTLIAFAEGRMSDNKDYGNINLVYKRSTNHGSTWSALQEVVGVGPGTWGNPTAVVDRNTGRVWLWM